MKSLSMTLLTALAGTSTLAGATRFRAGVVVSDELMVERAVTLVSDKLGRIAASKRQYILLNAIPPDRRSWSFASLKSWRAVPALRGRAGPG